MLSEKYSLPEDVKSKDATQLGLEYWIQKANEWAEEMRVASKVEPRLDKDLELIVQEAKMQVNK